MAFTSNNLITNNQPTEQPTSSSSNNLLTSDSNLDLAELEFLIKAIGNIDLKGHQVEMFYRMVIKLQNQYIERSKK